MSNTQAILDLAKKTIKKEADAVQNLSSLLSEDFANTVNGIIASKGRVVISGIGKSAIIASKIVSTLNSTGTPAIFMHAADAIHGDLGTIQDSDVVISHYYGLIRTFFLYLTFFVVLIVTVATTNGVLKGVSDYWVRSTMLDNIAYVIPYIGSVFAVVAIGVWLWRMLQGMHQLRSNKPHRPSTGPNL